MLKLDPKKISCKKKVSKNFKRISKILKLVIWNTLLPRLDIRFLKFWVNRPFFKRAERFALSLFWSELFLVARFAKSDSSNGPWSLFLQKAKMLIALGRSFCKRVKNKPLLFALFMSKKERKAKERTSNDQAWIAVCFYISGGLVSTVT